MASIALILLLTISMSITIFSTPVAPQELRLLPRFEETMQRRLGRSGIFVEVNRKY